MRPTSGVLDPMETEGAGVDGRLDPEALLHHSDLSRAMQVRTPTPYCPFWPP